MKGLEKHTSKAVNKEEGARRSRQEGLRGGGGLVKWEWHRGWLQGFIVAVVSLPLRCFFFDFCIVYV